MWDYGTPTAEEVMTSFATDELKAQSRKDAKVVEQLAPVVQSLEDDPNNFKMVLKRLRDPYNYYTYAVLTEFPRGVQAENPVQGISTLEQTLTQPDTIFFRPTTACVLHACDDLYKMQRQNPFYVPGNIP